MGLFRKKREEEDEELDEEEPKKLTPRRRKKKPEPPKPWGKKERFLVLGILLFTVCTSGVLALSARSWKLPGLPRLGLPKFSLFQEGTVVINKTAGVVPQEVVAASDQVVASFQAATKDLSGVYGLYVVDLDSGYSYGINESDTFQAASLIKLPVMVGMYLASNSGDIDLDASYTLANADKITGSGSLYYEDAGTVYTYRELIKYMGKQSDNTSFGVCRSLLGPGRIADAIRFIGMTGTDFDENNTTPQDIGKLFADLWTGKLLGKADTDELLSNMTDTLYEHWLADGVGGTKIAHKYGREVHVVNDAGIVYTTRPYVVVIMSKGVVEREADDIFPELSRIVYDAHKGLK